MTYKKMKVSLRMAFTMTRFASVKPLYEGFIVKINDRDWTVNIMMHGEIGLALIAGMNLRDKMDTLVREHCPMCHRRHGRGAGEVSPFERSILL